MKTIVLAILLFGLPTISMAQTNLYFEQKPPSLKPKVFAPGIISKKDESEFGSVFSKNGQEFFYGVDIGGRAEIRYSKFTHGQWTKPVTIISHKIYGYNDPFLSPDEQALFFISDQPLSGKGAKKDHDIWYARRTKKGWSKPVNAGKNINTEKNEYYMSFTQDGTMYFSSNIHGKHRFDYNIYAARWVNGQFQKAQQLGNTVNTTRYEADVFVALDESYLIFCGNRKGGLGRGDLYISFKQKDGTWTKAKNMGASINTVGHELCPFVTTDGKYLFYTSNQDIYWVDAKIIEQYRK